MNKSGHMYCVSSETEKLPPKTNILPYMPRGEIGDTVMLKDELWQKLWSGASVPKKILIKFMYFL